MNLSFQMLSRANSPRMSLVHSEEALSTKILAALHQITASNLTVEMKAFNGYCHDTCDVVL